VVSDHLPADSSARAWLGYRGSPSQVLLNLLTNIERYAYPNRAGGEVEIVIGADDTHQPPGFVLSVRDFGQGMPAQDVPRAFDPFFTTGRDKGGTGLGLAIVRNLVSDSLKGSVELTSATTAGTSVTIRLPRSAAG
jgi:signal transduction histidine kinase